MYTNKKISKKKNQEDFVLRKGKMVNIVNLIVESRVS